MKKIILMISILGSTDSAAHALARPVSTSFAESRAVLSSKLAGTPRPVSHPSPAQLHQPNPALQHLDVPLPAPYKPSLVSKVTRKVRAFYRKITGKKTEPPKDLPLNSDVSPAQSSSKSSELQRDSSQISKKSQAASHVQSPSTLSSARHGNETVTLRENTPTAVAPKQSSPTSAPVYPKNQGSVKLPARPDRPASVVGAKAPTGTQMTDPALLLRDDIVKKLDKFTNGLTKQHETLGNTGRDKVLSDFSTYRDEHDEIMNAFRKLEKSENLDAQTKQKFATIRSKIEVAFKEYKEDILARHSDIGAQQLDAKGIGQSGISVKDAAKAFSSPGSNAEIAGRLVKNTQGSNIK